MPLVSPLVPFHFAPMGCNAVHTRCRAICLDARADAPSASHAKATRCKPQGTRQAASFVPVGSAGPLLCRRHAHIVHGHA